MNNNFFLKTEHYRRKNRKAKKKAKDRNNLRAALKYKNRNRNKGIRISTQQLRNGRKIPKVSLAVGKSLSLFDDISNVIRITNLLDQYTLPIGLKRHIDLDLSNVTIVDVGALSFLLAKINQITKSRQVIISGNFPLDEKARTYIGKSGFLDHMTNITGNKFKENNDNFLIRIGGKNTDNESVGLLIKKCMKLLTGAESHYPPVFSIIQEMSGNSVEHANINNKNWLLGVNFTYNEDGNTVKHVTFTMADVGFGILNTIKRKWNTLIVEQFQLTSKIDILLRAFDRRYGSSTQEINRNRGLPLIKKTSQNGLIKGLKVITNKVSLDFENDSNSFELKNQLPGTFYCWKVDNECIQIWKKRKL